jgi:chemotaxis protein MotB
MSTLALILFVLVLLAYVQSLIDAKRVEALRHQMDASEQELRGLRAEIEARKTELAASQARLAEQQTRITDTDRQLDTLRSRLQSIAVLRVGVLNKLKDAIEAQLGPSNPSGAALVTIGDNGNIVINESLMFEYGSYAIKKDGKPLLDTLARALGNVLADPDVRASIDTIVIQGHTDERGAAALNWDLSARRATAVLDYLFEANGTLASSYGSYFSASAYSKFRPINPAATEAAYQQNRRIELSIVPRDDNVRKVIDDYVRGAGATVPP